MSELLLKNKITSAHLVISTIKNFTISKTSYFGASALLAYLQYFKVFPFLTRWDQIKRVSTLFLIIEYIEISKIL